MKPTNASNSSRLYYTFPTQELKSWKDVLCLKNDGSYILFKKTSRWFNWSKTDQVSIIALMNCTAGGYTGK